MVEVVRLPLGEDWEAGPFPDLGALLILGLCRRRQRLDKIQATCWVNRDPPDPIGF
jgi:hypothetical protein